MDAEILFFMNDKDQTDFFDVAKKTCDSISINSDTNKLTIFVGSCHLLFTPSYLDKNTIYIGSLEIRSSNFPSEVPIQDIERAKSIFRKLRNWIKKHYWSRLAYLNQNKNGKLTPSRNHWLGPNTKIWKEANSENILKLSKSSWMIFEIGY